MNEDTHVCCTTCKNLKMNMKKEFPFVCHHENECDFTDIEDSRSFSQRPFYVCRYSGDEFDKEFGSVFT